MGAFRVFLTIVFILLCIALTVIVLFQEGKSAGLGSIAGAGDTFWGKNKSRSKESMLIRITTVMAVLFLVLAAILNLKVI